MNMGIEREEVETVTASIAGKSFRLTGHAVYVVSILLVVGAFLAYLERRDRTESAAIERIEAAHTKIADQRIDQCHRIQVDSIGALERSSAAAVALAESLGGWNDALTRIEQHSIRNSETLMEILHQTRNAK